MIDNIKDFGWSWEVVPEEPWHIRYVAGDNVPAAVAAFTGGEAAPAQAEAAAAPAPAPAPAPQKEAGEILDIGSKGPKVRQLQNALKLKGLYSGPSDGNYSADVGAAVKKFKVQNKLAADTKAGGKVLDLLGVK
jgi:peptidoglycan hydrolase-like protein with peptidoglycan-binding domain